MNQDSLPLREVAKTLMSYRRYRDSSSEGRRELLDLLRAGSLLARFRFPSLKSPQIVIPATHWDKIRVGVFKTRMNVTGSNSGDYVVIPRQFRTLYVSWFQANCKLPEDSEELSGALRAAGNQAEVYILVDDWERFVTAEGLGDTQHSDDQAKSSRGLPENQNWLAIMIEVAVELLKVSSEPRKPVALRIAEAALKRITPREKAPLPEAPTVAAEVRKVIRQHWN